MSSHTARAGFTELQRGIPNTNRWDASLVAWHLIAAYRTCAKLPMRIFPSRTRTAWPEFMPEDRAALKLFKHLIDSKAEDLWSRRQKMALRFSPREISEMEAGISWPLLYLRH